MKITRIVKKDDNNVVVYFDNDEKFFLTYEVLLKNGLRKNAEIPADHFAFLIRENQKYHIRQKAFSYIARRHHSVFEIRIKLRQKGYDKDLIEEIIRDLSANKYLDDYEFSSIFTEENIRLKLWGKNKIKADLMKRGVDARIISEVLSENFPEGNDFNSAIELAKKKAKTLTKRNLEERKLKQKLYAFLSSRGYDYETSRDAVDAVIKDSQEGIAHG